MYIYICIYIYIYINIFNSSHLAMGGAQSSENRGNTYIYIYTY